MKANGESGLGNQRASERSDRRRSNNNGNMAIYNAALQDDLSRGYRVSLDGGGGKAATKRVIYGEQRRSGAKHYVLRA